MLDAIRELHKRKARIITTNYDDLLSRHCNTESIVAEHELAVNRFFTRDSQPLPILHVHGIWKEWKGAVLDGIDYFRITQDSHLKQSLQSLFNTPEVVMFVGTGSGLNDPNFGRLLDWADANYSGSVHRHYILLRKADSNDRKYLNKVVFGENYDELPGFLITLFDSPGRSAEGQVDADGG